jgi:hypothetical protein
MATLAQGVPKTAVQMPYQTTVTGHCGVGTAAYVCCDADISSASLSKQSLSQPLSLTMRHARPSRLLLMFSNMKSSGGCAGCAQKRCCWNNLLECV